MSSIPHEAVHRNSNPPPLTEIANGTVDLGQPLMGAVAVDETLAHVLKLDDLFEQARSKIRENHFLPQEGSHALLWRAALGLANQLDTRPSMPAIRAEIERQAAEAAQDNGGITPTEYQGLLGDDGLITQITSWPADSLTLELGRVRVSQFLQERAVLRPMTSLVQAANTSIQLGTGPRVPTDMAQRLHQAVDELDAIEERFGRDSQGGMQFISAEQFAQTEYRLNWHVPGILVQGQPCILAGPSKSLKTSIALDLAISMASRHPCARFLGQYAVQPHRVLFVSAESGEATIKETAQRICRSVVPAGVLELRELSMYFCFQAPRLSQAEDLRAIQRQLESHPVEVAIFDPLYLMLLSGTSDVSASNFFEMGPLLRRITRVCLDAGTTPILIHHFNRAGTLADEPPSLEHLAYAGIGEFARQWILVKRRERFDPDSGIHKLWLSAGGSAGFHRLLALDIQEGQLSDGFGGRQWNVTVQTAEGARVAAHDEREGRRRASQDAERQRIEAIVVEYLTHRPQGDVLSNIRAGVGTSENKCREALLRMEAAGRVEAARVPRGNNQTYAGYRLVAATNA